jgi:hypothetical protein
MFSDPFIELIRVARADDLAITKIPPVLDLSPKPERLFSTPVSIPMIAVPIIVTATMPIITPSAVSAARVLFARIWDTAIRSDSLISLINRFIPDVFDNPLQMVQSLVAFDEPIAQAHDAAGMAGDVLFVRHNDEGVTLRIKLFEQRHDFDAGF